ncbi:MAG: hypothetical protein ACLUVC_05535 [Longibaculum sp.]
MKKVGYVFVGIVFSYLYFHFIANGITQYYFRTEYEGLSVILSIGAYFVIVLPLLLVLFHFINKE